MFLCLAGCLSCKKLSILKSFFVHEKKTKSNCTNYSPISIMSIVSKVLECPDHSQISNFLEDKNLLSESRFGFSPQTVRPLRLLSRSGGPKTLIFSCSSLSVPLFYHALRPIAMKLYFTAF